MQHTGEGARTRRKHMVEQGQIRRAVFRPKYTPECTRQLLDLRSWEVCRANVTGHGNHSVGHAKRRTPDSTKGVLVVDHIHAPAHWERCVRMYVLRVNRFGSRTQHQTVHNSRQAGHTCRYSTRCDAPFRNVGTHSENVTLGTGTHARTRSFE